MNEPFRFDPPDTRPQPLDFTTYADGGFSVRKDWLMKGVLALGETSSIVGPPGAGKSALITDLSWHCAANRNWRGYKAQGVMAVVYIALERGDLLMRRFEAYRRRTGVERLPIAVVTEHLDLMQPTSVMVLARTIHKVQEAFFTEFRTQGPLLIIDTFAKAIALGGGDENSARDQNRVLGHLRQVQGLTAAHICLIGHTGKDEAKGARGSNAHLGDVDLMVQITAGRVKEAKVIKANDQAEGTLTTFALETYDFGPDDEGDPVTTSVVSQDTPESAPDAAARNLSPRFRLAMEALDESVGTFGVSPPAAMQLPHSIKAVEASKWKDELCARGVLRSEDPYLRQAFHRLRMDMTAKRLVGTQDELVWRACRT